MGWLLILVAALAVGAVVRQRLKGRAKGIDAQVVLRPLSVLEAPALQGRFAGTSEVELDSALIAQDEGSASVLVVWADTDPVGVAWIRWDGPPETAVRDLFPACPEIHSVEIDAALRSTGVGSRLLAMCEGMAIERGFQWIGAAVDSDNFHAYALYLRLNYIEMQRVEYQAALRLAGNERAAAQQRFLVKALQ